MPALRLALDKAREGDGPTLIECVPDRPPEEEDAFDAIFKEVPEETIYDLSEGRDEPAVPQKNSSAGKNASSAPVKYQKSALLRTLETLCGILFFIAMVLLILDIYLKG